VATVTLSKPHMVFVGCPWKTIRQKYEKVFDRKTFKRRFPLSFVIVGRDGNQLAEDLFKEIKRRIDSCSCALFDVSGGNANVALEYGYADGQEVPAYVFMNENKQFAKVGSANAIVSDLSGVRRNSYKNQGALKRALEQFAKQHRYTVRVSKATSRFRLSVPVKAALMAVPRAFTNSDRLRRADLMQHVMDDAGCDNRIADKAIDCARKG
jgi:hypothetical protein